MSFTIPDGTNLYERVFKFYALYIPSKLGDVQKVVSQFEGREEMLWELMQKKYTGTAQAPRIERIEAILLQVASVYQNYVEPLEKDFQYQTFGQPPLTPSEFTAKPMLLLLGQYSTGKTSFIKYILGKEFPGCNIGPEPTTDRVNCIMQGKQEHIIPGHALVADENRPFQTLRTLGTPFLNRLCGVTCEGEILSHVILVDTPGVLAGDKQRINRGYDFDSVVQWFAARCDRILLLFDANKLDISDELKSLILLLQNHSDKIRCVLNKTVHNNEQRIF